jgi:hypothetical protein
VPGREPDTADTLESDGLIKQEGNDVVVLKPDDLRVIAWQLGANEYCAHTGCRYPSPISRTFRSRKVTKGTAAPRDRSPLPAALVSRGHRRLLRREGQRVMVTNHFL